MNTKCYYLLIFICGLFSVTNQSITGVTYRDNFDFEERYARDDCNPLYWHPLHMPDHCTQMFEKLIRNRLYNTHPFQFRNNENEKFLKLYNRVMKSRHQWASKENDDESNESTEYDKCSSEESSSEQAKESFSKEFYRLVPNDGRADNIRLQNPYMQNAPPYLQMLNMIKQDVMTLPAIPVIGMLPSIGVATIYHQPVSKQTEKFVKKVAGAYASAAQDTYKDTIGIFPSPYSTYTNTDKRNTTAATDESSKGNYKNIKSFEVIKNTENQENHHKLNQVKKPNNKKKQVETKKIVSGNMVAHIQKKRYQG